jgi:hypothetical protein
VDLLARPVEDITFQDVVDFCDQEQAPESTVLDYKQLMPRDLAKHIAAMSNRYGGLIIVGVAEDPKTGTPVRAEGLANDGKLIERANQFAANVRPIPTCAVRTTNEVNGKVFLLVRIAEGGAPPYITTSEPTVYVRTGNVTIPLRQADADILGYLYGKRTEAETAQAENVARADTRLEAVIARMASAASPANQSVMSTTAAVAVGPPLRPLTIFLQPFYPRDTLAAPWEIRARLDELRLRERSGDVFPDRRMQPVARGMLFAQRGSQYRLFECHQVYADGLVHVTENSILPSAAGEELYLSRVARLLYLTLRFGGRLYGSFGYSGLVRGRIRMRNTQRRRVVAITAPDQPSFRDDFAEALDSAYGWPLEADTRQLANEEWLLTYFKQQMRQIHWDLGYSDVQAEALEYVITRLGVK